MVSNYKFYGEIGDNADTRRFEQFMREIGKRINEDMELRESADKCNKEFGEKAVELINNGVKEYSGGMILNLLWNTPRYHFYKNVQAPWGEKFDVQIDILERKFYLHTLG